MVGWLKRNPYLWVAVLFLFIFFWIGGGVRWSQGYIFDVLHDITAFGSASFIIPVACALPGVLNYFEEKQTLSYRYKILREGRLPYACRTLLKGMVSGGIVMGAALALIFVGFLFVTVIQGYHIHWVDFSGIYGYEYEDTIYVQLFKKDMGWLVLLLNACMMACQGTLWPCFGIIISAFVSNRKFAIVFPFLLFRVFAYIYDYNFYLTPIKFDMTLGIVYEPFGGFLWVAIYMLCVFALGVAALMLHMSYLYRRGD